MVARGRRRGLLFFEQLDRVREIDLDVLLGAVHHIMLDTPTGLCIISRASSNKAGRNLSGSSSLSSKGTAAGMLLATLPASRFPDMGTGKRWAHGMP